jgi:hypothetical protein
MSHPKEWTTDLRLSGLMRTLSHDLRLRPAGRLMKRILREHPQASFAEAIQLFREAALDDPEVLNDVVAEVFNRQLLKIGFFEGPTPKGHGNDPAAGLTPAKVTR